MKFFHFLVFLILYTACSNTSKTTKSNDSLSPQNHIIIPEFQVILDSAQVDGSILVYNAQEDLFYSNDFEWATIGNLPASTFKITNSIIALETGVVSSDSTLIKWDGKKRAFKIWEKDMLFRDAFHLSCVPCYQEIARKIGSNRMNRYLQKLDYGEMQVDSNNIDVFWLEGESKISQFQQIRFLLRFHESTLAISDRTELMMKRMMLLEDNDKYKLRAKTGWSIRNGRNNGWYVGYLEKADATYFFATNINPRENFNMDMFAIIRKEITTRAFDQLAIK